MRIINNDVLTLEVVMTHPDEGSKFLTIYIELDEDCYDDNGDYDLLNICKAIQNKYDYGHYYHEMTIEYSFRIDNKIVIKKYHYSASGIEKISSDIKTIK